MHLWPDAVVIVVTVYILPPKPSRHAMLRVLKASGEEAFAMKFEEFSEIAQLNEEPVSVLAVKRHLHKVIGQPRFRQRLLSADGQILSNGDILEGPVDIQLALLPLESSSLEQIRQLVQSARVNDIVAMESLLERPQDPSLLLASYAALHEACRHCCAEAAALLLEASADKDKALLHGVTPLHIASDKGSAEIVRMLLEANADKDKADKHDVTPLYVASQNGHLEIVRLLLEANADKDKATDDCVTPMHIAKCNGHMDILHLLREAGCKPPS